MGNKEIKELVVFFAQLANAADKSGRDGFQLADVANFVAPMMLAPDAFGGMDQIPAEFKDMDQAELMDLQKAVAEALDLADDQLEAVVEKALSAVINIYGIIQDIKALREAA